MLGCPGLDKSLGGVEGCPSVVDVRLGCGVVGRFPRGGVSEGLLPVLHLGSDWLNSPNAAPYKCQAHLHMPG